MGDIMGFLFFAAAFYFLVRCGCFAPLNRGRREQALPVEADSQQRVNMGQIRPMGHH